MLHFIHLCNTVSAMAKTNVIHKPNELIFLKPRERQRITALTRLIYNTIILFTQWQLHGAEIDSNRWFSCPLVDLLEVCGLLGKEGNYDYRHVKKQIREIRNFDIEWRFFDDDNRLRERGIGLIDKFEMAHLERSIVFSWKVDDKVQELLQNPDKLFSRINLEIMSKLSSGASMSLYEICFRYFGNSFGKAEGFTPANGLDWWILALSGNPQSHPEYKAFKRDTLVPAMKEINSEITDISIRLEEIKKGRSVHQLRFHISPKATDQKQDSEMSATDKRLRHLGLSEKQVLNLLNKYQENPSYLERHLAGAEFAKARNAIKTTAAGWLYKALDQDFTYEEDLSLKSISASHKLFDDTQEQLPKPVEKDKDYERTIALFLSLDGARQEKMLHEFFQMFSHWKRHYDEGLTNPLIRRNLASWLLAKGYASEAATNPVSLS